VSYTAIAERYARAIFELASEASQLGPVSEGIRAFSEAYTSSPELARALAHGGDEASRDALIKDLAARLGMPEIAQNAVRLMTVRRRLAALPDIAKMLTGLADDKAGVVRATVTSAKPLPEDYYRSLALELEQRTKRKVVLERRQDPALIGGVVTRIGDHTIDGSVQGRLAALESQLLSAT